MFTKMNKKYTIKENGVLKEVLVLNKTDEGGYLIKEGNVTRFIMKDKLSTIEVISENKSGMLLD